jgi:regulatory protein
LSCIADFIRRGSLHPIVHRACSFPIATRNGILGAMSQHTDREPPQANPPADDALHEAALSYLARYAATRAMVTRVLHRRIDRWAARAATLPDPDAAAIAAAVGEARARAACVVERLVASGVIDDAGFAANRARHLARKGRSRRAIAADLATRGVRAARAADLPADHDEGELAAAVTLARKRRVGPFRPDRPDQSGDTPDGPPALKTMALFARAGFSRELARRVLTMDRETAEALIRRLHAG